MPSPLRLSSVGNQGAAKPEGRVVRKCATAILDAPLHLPRSAASAPAPECRIRGSPPSFASPLIRAAALPR
jgi:hypothetical protein